MTRNACCWAPEPSSAIAEWRSIIHFYDVSKRDSRRPSTQLPLYPAPPRLFAPSQLRKMKTREQVAAVCFRLGRNGIEFLLVRTDRGKWTFPKGGAESGLTHAQSAALEAFEEAGVHGRIEEARFAGYRAGRSGAVVHAHLCEVVRLSRPQESDREPTWLSPEKAKRRLSRDRAPEIAAELIRVVDLAITRIQRLGNGVGRDEALQRVYVEASDVRRTAEVRTITIEPLPSVVMRRVAPAAVRPGWKASTGEPAKRHLLPAAPSIAGTGDSED